MKAEDEKVYKKKLVESHNQMHRFSEDWSSYLELQGQVLKDNQRFRSSEFQEPEIKIVQNDKGLEECLEPPDGKGPPDKVPEEPEI